MNKKFTKLIAALALLVFMTPTLAGWGQTRTEEVLSTCRFGTSYNQGNSSYTGTFVVTNGSYTWTVGNGNNNNNGWTNGDGYGQVKFGRKNNASVGYITTNANYSEAITKVELTIDAITADKINSIKLYTSTDNSSWTETGSFEKSIGVKTVSISDPTEDFYYKIEFDCASGSSNGLITVSKVDYYYNAGSGPVIATPTFDPVGGEYPSTQNVTISCETQGSTIYYTTDGSTPDNTSTEYTGAITVSETTTIKAIAYVGNDASSVASATYTIVQPLTTMQAIFDKATEVGNTATYAYITLGNWVVSGVSTNGKNVFVTDGTKGFVIFDNGGNMGFSAGNILSGTVYCKVQLYNGFAELTLLNSSTSGISVATGGTVTAANIAMADLTGVNTGALVHYDNLTCNVNNNNYLLTDGTTTLQAFNSLYAFGSALVDNHVYNITGVYQQYTTSSTSTKEVLPRSADDIEEVVVIEPSVTVTPSSINAPFTGAEGTLTVTYENITEVLAEVYFCDANGEAATYGNWIQADIDEDNNVFYVIGANDGEARTAYLKVWAYDDDLINEVYSNLVTVNQAEYVAPTYAELPFSFNGGRDDIEGTDGLNQEGLGSDYSSSPKLKFDGTGDWLLLQFDERPGTLTFDIKNNSFSGGTFTVQTSEDGVTFTDLENYISITGTQSEEFDNLGENVRYIKWIYTEKSSGNVGLGNITLDEYVAPVPTIAIDPESISLTAAGTEFATATVSYTNLEKRVAEICLYETYENGECSDKVTNNNNYWFAPSFATNNDEQIEYMAEANTGAARTVYMRVEALGGDSEMYYSNLVTVTQAAAPQQYTLTVTLNDNVSAIYVFNTEDVNNPLIEDGLAGTANVLEGTEIMVSPDVAEGYMLESLMINNENVISQLDESGAYTFTMPASNVTISATAVEQVVPTGGIITFGSGEGSTNINKATVTGNDSKGNTWTITTEGTNSFTPNANYAQVGSGNNPATSITFTTTLPASSVVSAFEAKFGGFNGTAGNITLMVDNNNVGTGSLNGTSDVIVSSNTTATGTVLTVTVTNIAKGVKCYYISYTLGESTNPYINLIADGDIYTPVDAYHMEFTYLPSGGQIDKVEYGNFQGELTYEDFHIQYCDAEGQHIDETPDWFGQYGAPHVVLNTTENLLYLDVETALNEGPARTCYFKVYAYVSASEAVYSNLVTVTQAAAPQPSITFTSNIAQFTPVDAYHIELNNTNEGGYIDQVVTENFQGTLVASDFHVEFCDANGGSVPANSDWLTVEVALPTWSTGPLYLEVAPIANEGAARTAYFKVWANNGNTPVYSDVVTVTQAAPVADYATLPFEYTDDDVLYNGLEDMPNGLTQQGLGTYTNSTPRLKFDSAGDYLILKLNAAPAAITFDIKGNGFLNGIFTVQTSTDNATYTDLATYTALIGTTQTLTLVNTNSAVRYIKWVYTNKEAGNVALGNIIVTEAMDAVTESTTWDANTFVLPETSHSYVVSSGATLTLDGDFSEILNKPYYLIIEDGGQLVTHNAVQATMLKDVEKATNWGNETTYTPDGWYFISSPVNGASFNTATASDYDLYMLDWANKKWRNMKIATNISLFGNGFQRGMGYLYASKDDNTLSLAGEIQPLSDENNAIVTLTTDGWNLIGNPLTCKVSVGTAFNVLNNGSTYSNMVAGSTINPCQGIAVYGDAGTTVTFTKVATQSPVTPGNSSLQMTLSQNVITRGNASSITVDNAIVSFTGSSVLPKFTMLEGNATLYIPQGTEEYAIVSSNGQGEMPVNFRANENGTYSLTVNPENVEMNYLHLIDNMTGADVDLLQEPTYTFNAKTTDYESRFRLVFASATDNAEGSNDSFAFISNGQIIIANEGQATLQVVDVMGRILSSETINGSVSKSLNAPAGIYMLRLVNGDNVKVQKMVVR